MAKQSINVGSSANDRQGDSLRAAFQKVNANFTELYTALGLATDINLNLGAFEFSGSTMSTTDSTAITIDQATTVTSDLTVGGDIIPQTANGGDLGSAARPWKSLYVSGSTIYLGGNSLKVDTNGELILNNNPIVQANGNYISLNLNVNDVNISDPQVGDTLQWAGGFWINVPAESTTGDLKGSVFADDSTLLVDAVSGSIPYSVLSGAPIIPTDISDLTDNTGLLGGSTNQLVNGANTVSLGSDGTLTLPGTGTIRTAFGAMSINAPSGNSNLSIKSNDATTYMIVGNGSAGVTAGAYNWQFSNTGNLTFPDSTVQTTAWAGNFGYLTAEKDTIKGTAGYQYTFNTDGYFTGSTSSESTSYFFVTYNATNANIAAGWTVVGANCDTTVSSVVYPVAGYPNVIRVNLTAAASGTVGFYPVIVTSPDRLQIEIQPNPNNAGKYTFTTAGITFPDSTVQTTAWTGLPSYYNGDMSGSVFADDSTMLVDGTGAKIVGPIETSSLRTNENKIALGSLAGFENQNSSAIAIGGSAGVFDQGTSAIAIGSLAGYNSQGASAVAVGALAGNVSQGTSAVAVGAVAGSVDQGLGAVAIGGVAGYTRQGANAIAIGSNAGHTDQPNNSIILNASGSILNGSAAGFFVDPIRNIDGDAFLNYNSSTKEIGYSNNIRRETDFNIDINLSDSTLHRWTFGEDGELMLPSDGKIRVADGSRIRLESHYSEPVGNLIGSGFSLDPSQISINYIEIDNGNEQTRHQWDFSVTLGTLDLAQGGLRFFNGTDFDGTTVTMPTTTTGTTNSFVWEFSDQVVGSDTITLNWNLLATEQGGFYFGTTHSTNGKYLFLDGTDQSLSYFASGVPGNGKLIFGAVAGNNAGDANAIELKAANGDIYLTSTESVKITVDAADSSARVWTFDPTGGLTFPDATTQTTAFTANPTLEKIIGLNQEVSMILDPGANKLIIGPGTWDGSGYDGLTFTHNADYSRIQATGNDTGGATRDLEIIGGVNLTFSTNWAVGSKITLDPDGDGIIELKAITNVTGVLKIDDGVHEALTIRAGDGGGFTSDFDCSTGHISYCTSVSGNWTANFINLNLAEGYATVLTLVIEQTGTPGYPTAVQIEGNAKTLIWQGNTPPTPTNTGIDVVTFSILRTGISGNEYVVLGQMTGF